MHVITFGKANNTGLPLLQELRLAAERGVRVRLWWTITEPLILTANWRPSIS